MEEKKINSFKKYIQSQENKLDEYYKLDDSFYKDEIEQLELSILLLKSILNIIENSISKDKIKEKLEKLENNGIYEGNGYYCSGAKLVLQELLESEE